MRRMSWSTPRFIVICPGVWMISIGMVPKRATPNARQRVTVSGSCSPISNFLRHSAYFFAYGGVSCGIGGRYIGMAGGLPGAPAPGAPAPGGPPAPPGGPPAPADGAPGGGPAGFAPSPIGGPKYAYSGFHIPEIFGWAGSP